MAQAVRGSRPDALPERDADSTAPELVAEDEWICVECSTRLVDFVKLCPECGGVIVSKNELEESNWDPLIGRKLGGRFTIVARLGAGSMGAVYRARQDGMAREVALKVLKPERAYDASSKARFEREARATSALTSPHTVTVYDFGEDESTPQGPLLYLAMERLDGESLGQRIKRVGRVPPAEAIKIAQQALRSLSEAHDKGVVHRDLKPDNIFLHNVPTPHGLEEVVKVLDFGIAKIVQPDLKVDSLETQAGTVFGTPRYMSPEQAQSKPLDARSDLYTVGLILFQMVTGRHCFPDEDAVVVMARHIQSLPPRPREIAPDAGISRKLEAVILHALAKDPRRRPQSALEFHEELAAALLDSPEPHESAVVPVVQTTSIGPVADPSLEIAPAPQPPPRRDLRSLAFGVAFVVVLVGAVGVGIGLAQRRAPAVVYDEPKTASATPEPTLEVMTAPSPAPAPSASVEPEVTAKPAATTTAPKPKAAPKPSAKAEPTPTVVEPPKVESPPPPPPATTATAKKKPGSYGKFE
ncbi:MAG: serine/threonine protein kinase [Deltaproteobacteria bacterium]|nr:serine/threonine protein kinase [Deltaproteobacteria bacterium]